VCLEDSLKEAITMVLDEIESEASITSDEDDLEAMKADDGNLQTTIVKEVKDSGTSMIPEDLKDNCDGVPQFKRTQFLIRGVLFVIVCFFVISHIVTIENENEFLRSMNEILGDENEVLRTEVYECPEYCVKNVDEKTDTSYDEYINKKIESWSAEIKTINRIRETHQLAIASKISNFSLNENEV
jgi:hypothetical protein